MCWVADNLISEGKVQGILQTLNSLVADNILSLKEAAERAGMTEKEYTESVKSLPVSARR